MARFQGLMVAARAGRVAREPSPRPWSLERVAGRLVEMELTASGVPAMPEQLRLIVERPRRSLTAANRALARIRATFGDDAVVRARLTDGHLPEASFTWEPLGLGPSRFMTLEDETGFVNVVLWPQLFERHAVLAKTARFLGVTGTLQVEQGVVHSGFGLCK